MIIVNGKAEDYAILKQVQQLKLLAPDMAVEPFDFTTDLSKLLQQEEDLYLVSHGQAGQLRDVPTGILANWLRARVVPPEYAGRIILLSCYSGANPPVGPSLAGFLAEKLKDRALEGVPVEGATGYSYGTPRMRETGYSSVLALPSFYTATDVTKMVAEWLNLKPTHTGGVLTDKLGIAVDTGQTIREQLAAAQSAAQAKESKDPEDPPAKARKVGKSPEEIAQEYAQDFAVKDRKIVDVLDGIARSIPGGTVAKRVDYLVNPGNAKNDDVVAWNDAINQQYDLYYSLYLWKSQTDAFTVAYVG